MLWKSSISPENTELPEIIDMLEVSYQKGPGGIYDYPATELYFVIVDSRYIVSATVSELKNIDGSKECYLDVNEVLKGNIEVNQIILRTKEVKPELKEGDEYVLFIKHAEEDNIDHYYLPREGYLIKNGSVYKGLNPQISITYKKLSSEINELSKK